TGRVIVEVERLSMRKLAGEVDFTLQRPPSADEIEFEDVGTREPSAAEAQLARNVTRGITPAEGCEALMRVLAGEYGPRVVISSLDLPALIEQAERAA